ncbi:putative protein isoform X2 [Capsicum annuum]|uniref:uncharacterized protein LOC107842763 isoform X2 n=1 Tax=Capsicum annuum TaxID=4072 RepID=UPI0007BF0CBA|nr:uncharacterized protein LOC107842763 isoform X2 [Capsicum annuum]
MLLSFSRLNFKLLLLLYVLETSNTDALPDSPYSTVTSLASVLAFQNLPVHPGILRFSRSFSYKLSRWLGCFEMTKKEKASKMCFEDDGSFADVVL